MRRSHAIALIAVGALVCSSFIAGCTARPQPEPTATTLDESRLRGSLPDADARSDEPPSELWTAALETLGSHQGGEIPESDWAEPIRRLAPLRVYIDSLNIIVVLDESGTRETGKYIVTGLSSFVFEQGYHGFRFAPDPGELRAQSPFEEIYDYTLEKD